MVRFCWYGDRDLPPEFDLQDEDYTPQTEETVELHEDMNDRRPGPPHGTALMTTDIPALIDKEVS